MNEIVNPRGTNGVIFDKSFQRSRLYFEVLQHLSLFRDRIRETGHNLKTILGNTDFFADRNLGEVFGPDFHDGQYHEIVRDNWAIMTKYQEEAERRLLNRILEKTEEVESLHDGVCSQMKSVSCSSNVVSDLELHNTPRSIQSHYGELLYCGLYCCNGFVSPTQFHWGMLNLELDHFSLLC